MKFLAAQPLPKINTHENKSWSSRYLQWFEMCLGLCPEVSVASKEQWTELLPRQPIAREQHQSWAGSAGWLIDPSCPAFDSYRIIFLTSYPSWKETLAHQCQLMWEQVHTHTLWVPIVLKQTSHRIISKWQSQANKQTGGHLKVLMKSKMKVKQCNL